MKTLDPSHRRQITKYALAALMRYRWMHDSMHEIRKSWIEDDDLKNIYDLVQAFAVHAVGNKSSFKGWLLAQHADGVMSDDATLALALSDYALDEVEANRAIKNLHEFGRLDEVKKLYSSLEARAAQVGIAEAVDGITVAVSDLPWEGDGIGNRWSDLIEPEGEWMRQFIRKQEHYLATGERLRENMVLTGWAQLDDAMGGLQPGRLVVIGARPGNCKSATMLQWAHNIASGNEKVLFVSLEMSETEIAHRLLACQTALSLSGIADGTLSAADFKRLTQVLEERRIDPAARIWTIEGKKQTLASLRRVCREHAKQGIKVVFVDYLQIMEADSLDRNQPRHVQVATMSRGLKQLAQELKICIVVGAQLSREVEGRADPKPQLRDLRESGSIEQDADQVLLLDRPELRDPNDRKNLLVVYLRKNRHGRPMEVQCDADLVCQRIHEMPPVTKITRRYANE